MDFERFFLSTVQYILENIADRGISVKTLGIFFWALNSSGKI